MSTESDETGINKCGFYEVLQRERGAKARRAPGRVHQAPSAMGQGGGQSPKQLPGCLPLRALLPWALPVDAEGKRAVPGIPRAHSVGSRVPAPHAGAVGAEGQVRGSGRCSLSPRCELIIQMGCPGSGDWRPAPARRAISPAAHVTAALVRSRSTPLPPPTSPPPPSPLSLHLPTPHLPPRRELPAASGQLGTAILGLQRVARERGGIGRPALRAPGLRSGPPPIFGPLLPRLTPPAHFQLPPRASPGREREWSRERGSAREGGRGRCLS